MPTHRCPVAQRLFFFVLESSPKMESSAIRADSLLPIYDTPLRYVTVFLLPPFMSPQEKWPPCLRRWGHLHLGWARLCGASGSIPVVRWPSFCFVQCVLQRINAAKSHSRNRGRFKQAIPHVLATREESFSEPRCSGFPGKVGRAGLHRARSRVGHRFRCDLLEDTWFSLSWCWVKPKGS